MEEEEKKNGLAEWLKEHPKTTFATRVALWLVFSAALPFAFIAWRYDIFTAGSKIKLTGWGVIGIIIVAVVLATLVKYLYKMMKPGILKQCITGFLKVILPLLIVLAVVKSIESGIKMFEQALCCVIVCESAAIPLNPFPEIIAKIQEEEGKAKIESMSDLFWDGFFKRKKDE